MSEMLLGLAAWHYPHRTLTENIDFFSAGGFRAFSAIGGAFAEAVANEASALALAEAIAKRDTVFTVHYKIPSPDNGEETAAFDENIVKMREWQEKYGLLRILSFDVWGDRKACVPKMLETVKLFAGSGAAIAFEDVPLNGEEAAWFSDFPAAGDYGILADLGHMNLRLSKAGDNSPSAFAKAYAALPLHVYELHLHNNDGIKDSHDMMWNGTMDYAAVAAELHRARFDGVFTIESVPGWHGMTGSDTDAAIFRCRDYWQELWTR